MTEYYCVFEGTYGRWVSSHSTSSKDEAREYAAGFKSALVDIIAAHTGICPPVGMRADQASHRWVRRIHTNPAGYTLSAFKLGQMK